MLSPISVILGLVSELVLVRVGIRVNLGFKKSNSFFLVNLG